ncbi:MAG TPA: Hsp70 family protein, partial [Hyphomicrobiaceae bacterium]|nr:Hsp70 family protein [Hyphomicrobiaceae bacterium]
PKVATDIGRVRRDAREPDKLGRLLRVIDARKGHALLGSIEQVKIALSEREATDLSLLDLADIGDTQVTRRHLEDAIGDAVAEVTARLRATLRDAGVAAAAIDAVFLTGGSSKLPLLRAQIRAVFPNAKIVEGDAFGSVATGLTIDAHTRFGP